MINWDKFKCRCSAISKIMAASRDNPCLTEKQGERLKELEAKDRLTDKMKLELADLIIKRDNAKKVVLSDGAIEYLMEVYAWETQGMIPVTKEAMDIWATKKGKEVEEDSITLLTLVDKEYYQKNDIRVENEYLSGEPDVFVGEEIYKAERVTDIKSLWDYPTFLKSIHKPLENGYTDQVRGYGDITGATKLEVAKCLVNMPMEMILDFKRKMSFRGGYLSDESPDFLKEWEVFERSMIFDQIPHEKRVFKLQVEPFTPERKQMVYDRVKICREWLSKFDEMYQQINS